MTKVYMRTENGNVDYLSVAEALAIVNHAMMGGRREVRRMSSGRSEHEIEYKNGTTVTLVLTDPTAPTTQAGTDEPTWSTAGLGSILLHRFTDEADPAERRALCNKRFRPVRYADGFSFRTRADREAGVYPAMYTYCPRCESK